MTKEISTDKLMTIKEVAEVLEVSRDLIEKRIKELYPHKMSKGRTTYLNELEVTELKLRIQENSSLMTSDDRRKMPQTQLEKHLIVAQAMDILATEIKELKAQNNRLLHASKTYTTTEIAKELNIKSAVKLNRLLERKNIQYKINGTWVLCSEYAELNYTDIKQFEINGKPRYDRRWTGIGRDFLIDLLGENK